MQLLLDPEVRQISMGALHQLHIDVKECEGEACSFYISVFSISSITEVIECSLKTYRININHLSFHANISHTQNIYSEYNSINFSVKLCDDHQLYCEDSFYLHWLQTF